ncbi:MAG TPA: Ig-like domain-containing protein, partial [Anaerolineae bacterium]|nr:Ig-like domain-containing protein [Anaerolineae bacterium]
EVSALVRDEAQVDHVEFRVDGRTWASLSAAPFRVWWSLAEGKHRLVAIAVDRQGRRSVSDPVTVVVEEQ